MSDDIGAYRIRRKGEEVQRLTALIDSMRAHSSPGVIERWLVNLLAEELAEWSGAEAVHALMAHLAARPRDRSLDTLRNASVAAQCLERFCGRYQLAEPRDGWREGMVGDPFTRRTT